MDRDRDIALVVVPVQITVNNNNIKRVPTSNESIVRREIFRSFLRTGWLHTGRHHPVCNTFEKGVLVFGPDRANLFLDDC